MIEIKFLWKGQCPSQDYYENGNAKAMLKFGTATIGFLKNSQPYSSRRLKVCILSKPHTRENRLVTTKTKVVLKSLTNTECPGENCAKL